MAITINRTTSLDGAILPEYMPGLLYMNENQAHKFVITCTRGGSAVTLTGSITGRFMRADGQTILLSGSISSGKANLTLPQSCYIVPGRFTMAIFNVTGNAVTTIYALTGNVARTQTDTLVDPGNTVPTIDNLLAEIDAMRQATADANAAATKSVRYDTTQSLTETQKSTARGNIDAAGLAQVVRVDSTQTLSSAQKNTALGNIGAKPVQSAVSNPTASGTSTTFVDSITQNTNGVITPTRKSIPNASQSAAGLMTSADKTKLDGIATGAQVNSITGVKGNAESSYRTGQVNLTPANIGAQPAGDYVQYASQSLTDAQKRQVRANIDTPSNADLATLAGTVISIRENMAVRYDATQNLTDEQKVTARENIDAAGLAQVVRHDAVQSLNGTQKATARTNIGAPDVAETNGTHNIINTFIKNVNGINLMRDCGAEYNISADGVWTFPGSKHIVIPVQPGANINITARPAPGSTVYAFLKSYKIAYNAAADFCNGYNSRVVMAGGTSESVVAPSDCNFFFVSISNQSGANTAPDALTIDGVDVLFNMRVRAERSIHSYGILGDSSDVDDLLPNTIAGVAIDNIENVAHFPKLFGVGGTIVTLQYNTNLASVGGRSQLFFPLMGEPVNEDSAYAYRVNISGTWSAWEYHGYYKVTVNVGAGELFNNPANALKYYTSETEFYKWNEHRRLEIVIAPGTYSLNDIILWYADDPITYRQGLFIPPYATIRGSGKKRTMLRYTPSFSEPDDERLSSISPFNMPYESTLKDLSLVVKNCRYCIHSEGTFEGFPDGTKPIPSSYVNNCQITLENVYLEHMGIETQYTPRYTAPACWGSGSYNNSNQTFRNCEFIAAQYSAWLNHNRVGLTDASRFDFDNCVFINKNDINYAELGVYSSVMFISWADDDIKNPVTMKNCFANRMVLSAVRSGDPASDTPKNNYYIMTDNDIYIVEQITNNAHRTDNYISGNCVIGYANEALSVAYAPVSYDESGMVSVYSPSALLHGIVLQTAAQGDVVCIQTKGRISLARCRVSEFNVGDYVGYSNGAWVLDTNNPIIRVISANIGEIV